MEENKLSERMALWESPRGCGSLEKPEGTEWKHAGARDG